MAIHNGMYGDGFFQKFIATSSGSKTDQTQSGLAIPGVIRLHLQAARCAFLLAASLTAGAFQNVFRGMEERRPRPQRVPEEL